MALILHASAAKDTRYAIPLFPFLFLMTGVWMQQAAERSFSIWEKWAIGVTGIFIALILVLIPTTYIALVLMPPDHLFKGADILLAPGVFDVRASILIFALILIFEVVAGFKLRELFKASKRAESLLIYPVVFAAFLIPIAGILMPAYDFQRTFVPFTDMVKNNVQSSNRMALIFDETKYVGIFTFYLNRHFTVLNSPQEAAGFLQNQGIPSSVIVKTHDIDKIEGFFPHGKVSVLKCNHKGYNGDRFRLIMNHPIRWNKVL
jgi:hypothetical protein